MPASCPLQREPYLAPFEAPEPAAQAHGLLALLRAQTGSTTRLCETLAGGPVALHLLHQATTLQVPESVRSELPGTRFIERVTCLAARGEVMTDNLVFVAMDGLDARLQHDLEQARVPIGHLLADAFTHRHMLEPAPELQQRLWRVVGQPDPAASRAYRLATAQGLRMLIMETFRRGMRGNDTRLKRG
jgi:chorismate-pyruvate lyase